jgi:hypothetical protein
MTQVLLTVDTELNWAPHARGESWQQNLAGAFDPAGVGVPWQLEVLRDHGLKACFFVDPMPALVYGLEPIRRMVEPILAAGQEVQLHLHPVWQSVAEGVAEGARFELTCFDAEDQLDLIETARDLLVDAGAPDPIAFRSGGYAADVRTLAALVEAGLRFDSSHNGSYHPDPSALPLEADLIGPADLGGLVEVPVTQIGDTAGRLRHLQLCAVSAEPSCGDPGQPQLRAGEPRRPPRQPSPLPPLRTALRLPRRAFRDASDHPFHRPPDPAAPGGRRASAGPALAPRPAHGATGLVERPLRALALM